MLALIISRNPLVSLKDKVRWQTKVNWRNWKVTRCLLNFAAVVQLERVECKIFSTSASLPLALESVRRHHGSQVLAPNSHVERTWGRGTTDGSHGTTSATVIARFFRFLLLGQWFSLQSWCVQWSIESAEGSVLPLSDGQEVDSGWVYIGSTKTAD